MELNQMIATNSIPDSNQDERRCYTVEEVMAILGVGRKAVYSMIHRKDFPAICIHSVGYRIPKKSFNAWLYQQQV